MSSDFPIQIHALKKSFRRGRDQVLKGVDISFPKGKLTYILGPSGTGKSVLIKHILGLLKPDSGQVKVFDQELSTLRDRELAQHRLRFGMLFQNSALFDDLNIFENVAFPLYEHTHKSDSEIKNLVHTALESVGMNKGYDKLPNELSGGMRKRVGLARAIVRKPEILLYDEPTTGLDPVTREMVDDLIAKLKITLRVTSIVISHDIPSALRLADQIAFLFEGNVAFFGTPEEFRQSNHAAIQKFIKAENRAIQVLSR